MDEQFRKIVEGKECLACKIFTVPLFYLFSGYFGLKNYRVFHEDRLINTKVQSVNVKVPRLTKIDKFGLVMVPFVMFTGGTFNIVRAFLMLRTFRE